MNRLNLLHLLTTLVSVGSFQVGTHHVLPRTNLSPITQLGVSIGLGPEEKQEDQMEEVQFEYEVPNHEEHRLDRLSKLDIAVDDWFGNLLPPDDGILDDIAATARSTLTTLPELVNEVELDREDPEWTPYVNTKLPWSVLRPAYGLEQFGLPTPRRNAEAWRQFDVPGLISHAFSNQPPAMSLSPDELQAKLQAAGYWVEDCAARLVYCNGQFVPELSVATETAVNLESVSSLTDEERSFLARLPDGWTDTLAAPVPVMYGEPLTSYATLSGPSHKIGSASSQFAINTQHGTACFAALNTVACSNVGVVRISGTDDSKPIVILNVVTNDSSAAVHPRTLVVAEANSQASVMQHTVSLETDAPAPSMTNGYTQILVHENANVTHVYVEETNGMPTRGVEESDDAIRSQEAERPGLDNTVFETIDVHCVGQNAHYFGTILNLGASGRTKVATGVTLLQPGSSCKVHGFSLSGGDCRSDIKTNIHHIADGCESEQLQKNMVGGRATTSFRGRIRVEQSAQQTESQQLSRTILLTDTSRAWAIPSLEIIADDVQCAHGATVSDLSEEELFYLKSRGLNSASARNLLMFAFCNDIVNEIPESIRGTLKSINTADKDDVGLQMRILRKLENLVPRGERAVRGEFSSI